ncbi:MAG: hypothetical protein P4L68_11250 [Methylovirgula sp.]|nr:hypothetical protein [Methylovirgula sp.]
MTLLTNDFQRADCPAAHQARIDTRRVDGRLTLVTGASQALLVLAIWLFSRGYNGIRHDARIYIGRALADLEPNGVGRDALFAFDNQTHLTAYSLLTTPLVRLLGASVANIVITYATLSIWIAAATWLAWQVMPRRLIPAALICAATLPAFYGPFNIFSFAEPFAVPRGLAEAGVLFALAALLSEKRLLACGAILFALALHVPTALVGAGVVFILLAVETPALWLAAIAFGAIAIMAALLQLGPFKGLLQSYDPVWLAINRERNPFLFESLWPAAAWSQAIVSGTTLAMAIFLTQGRVRQVLIAAGAIALIGVGSAYVFGELPSNMLILQLQAWRALWLVKLLAILLIPYCASILWSDERVDSRLVVVLFACCWFFIDEFWLTLALSGTALLLLVRRRFGAADSTAKILLPLAIISGLGVALVWVFGDILVELRLAGATLAAGLPLSAQESAPLLPTLGYFVAVAAIALSLVSQRVAPSRQALIFASLAVIVMPLALFSADHRDTTHRMTDAGAGRDTLAALLGPTPKGIAWIDEDIAPLFWVGRPSWVNGLQGTAGAFSRPLALQWDARSRLLVANGLATENERDPYLPAADNGLDPAKVARGAVKLCKTSNGPDAIVVPNDLAADLPAKRTRIWRTPAQNVEHLTVRGQNFVYVQRDRYAILRCTDIR